MEPPKYIPGSDAWKNRLDEALRNNDVPLVVHCFGVPEGHYEIIGDKVRRKNEAGILVMQLYRKETDLCPICGRLLEVWYVPGTQPLGTCSEEHTRQVVAFIAQQHDKAQKRKGTYTVLRGAD